MRDAQMEIISTLKQSLTTIRTSSILIEVMTHYLKSWMRQTEPTFHHKLLSTLPLHKLLLDVIEQQTEIGWDNLLRGRISKLWHKAQKLHCPTNTPTTWTKQYIKLTIQATDSVWSVRNTLKFGETTPTLSNAQLRLKYTITEMYSTYKQKIHPSHHHLFQTPLRLRISFSPQENSQWIKTVKATIKLNKQKERQFFSTHIKITKYFSPRKRKAQEQTTQGITQGIKHTFQQEKKKLRQTHIFPQEPSHQPPSDAPT